MAQYLMSLDLGGSAAKGLLVDAATGQSFSSEKPWSNLKDAKYGGFALNLDLVAIWKALGDISKALISESGISASEIMGLAITSMRHTTIVLNGAEETLLATPNLDARALAEAANISEEHGEEIYSITGHWPSAIMAGARLKWLAEKEPSLFVEAKTFFTLADWVGFKLTGQKTAEASLAAETLLLDLKKREWSEEVLRYLSLPKHLFPPIINAGQAIGTLSSDAAKHLGLKEGLLVAAGGADTQAGLLGMGIYESDKLGIVAGSTTPVVLTSNQVFIDPQRRTWASLTLIPGQYICESNAGSMGSALELFAKMLYADSHNPLFALNQDAAKLKPGETSVLSTAGAQLFNGSAVSIPLDSLTLSSMSLGSGLEGRMQVSRSILEGMAYGVLANLDQIKEVASNRPDKAFIGGGMSRSAVWSQMVADLLDLPVAVPQNPNATAFGASLCAGVAAGVFKNLPEAVQKLALSHKVFEPDRQDHRIYMDNYETWKSIRENRTESDSLAIGHMMTAMDAAPESKSTDCTLTIKPNIFASADLGDKSIEVLRSIGHLTYQNYLETGQILSGTELIQALKGAQIFITEMDVLDAATLSQLPDLRVVFVCRGNPVNIDIAACSAAGIPVINTPGRNADAVADLTLAYMLALLRRMPEAAAFLHEPGGEAGDMGRMTQAFTGLRGDELWNKVVGLVGCGAVGRKVVERLLPFGAKVMVYDPFLDSDQISLLGASKSSLEQLITQSDIISLHTAVNPETENMFSTEAFAQMKDGVYFINTARAALVNQPAMLQALKNGKIKGAALDVFAEEPPAANDPLILLENVIATPHIGGNTNQLSEHQGMILIDDLNLLMRGLSPKHILNPEVMSEFSWIEKRNVDLSKLEERKAEPGPGMRDLDVKSQLTKEPVRPADAPLMTASISQKLGEPYKEEPKTVFSAIKKLFGLAKPESTPQSVLHKDAEPKASPQPLEQGMVPVLKNFLKGMESAPAIIEFSTGKQIIYTFTIKELEQPFYMAFKNGIVKCDFGEPENPADVKLKMSASVLVDIIRARINPTKAAMTGKLSFSGDTAKALTLSKLNLKDVYDAACAKMGVSGEASSLLDAAQNSAIQGAAAQGSQTLSPAAKQESQANGFEELMAVFLGEMQNDEALKQFSEEKNILYTFTIKEMEKPFFMHFNNGVVKSVLGEPESTPDVKLKMSAHVLVDIILGRINPTKAAMTGKLSFSGDTAKALALSKVNLKDAYLLASKTLGVSGEAAELLEKKGPDSVQNKLSLPHTPVSAHAAEQTLQAAQKPNRVGDVRDEILDVLNELYQKGLVTSTGGNISARTDDNSNEFWITPAGVFKGDLSADKMVRIDLEGNVVGESDFSASSERHVHCAIYRNRPDIAAVIHSHSPNATLLGITGTPFLPISTEAAFIGDLPVAPFVMPGTKELSLSVAKAMGDKSFACILQNHGLVVAGTSPRKAADTTEIVEETCSKLLICRQMGVAPSLVPEEAVKQLKEMGAMLA